MGVSRLFSNYFGKYVKKIMPVLGYILMLNIILKHSISVISTSEDSFWLNKQENCILFFII